MFSETAKTPMSLGWQTLANDLRRQIRAKNAKTAETPMSLGTQMQTKIYRGLTRAIYVRTGACGRKLLFEGQNTTGYSVSALPVATSGALFTLELTNEFGSRGKIERCGAADPIFIDRILMPCGG